MAAERELAHGANAELSVCELPSADEGVCETRVFWLV